MASSVSSAGTSIGRSRTRRHRSRLQPAFEVCFTTHMWILRTVAEGEPEKTFRVMPGGIRTVGRATGADFIVDAPLVSRVHCRLTALPTAGSRFATSRAPTARLSTASASRRRACRRATGSASGESSSWRCATPIRIEELDRRFPGQILEHERIRRRARGRSSCPGRARGGRSRRRRAENSTSVIDRISTA